MAEDVAAYLSRSLGLPRAHEAAVRQKLGRKFRLALIGESQSLKEALATTLVQFTPLALSLEAEWKSQELETHFGPERKTPPTKIYVPREEVDVAALKQQVAALGVQVDPLMQAIAQTGSGRGAVGGTVDFRWVLEQLKTLDMEKSALLQGLKVVEKDQIYPPDQQISSPWLGVDYAKVLQTLSDLEHIIDANTLSEGLARANIDPASLPQGPEIFSPRLELDYKGVIQRAVAALPVEQTIEGLLTAMANKYFFHLKLYSLKNGTVSSFDYMSERLEYLTAYVFLWEQKAAVLVPTKYLVGIVPAELKDERNSLVNNRAFHRAVFVSKRSVDPPKPDRHAAEKLKIIDNCMCIVQDLCRPLVHYTPLILERYYAKKTELDLVGMDLTSAKKELEAGTKEVERNGDLGQRGKAGLRKLLQLLEKQEEVLFCAKCHSIAPDVTLQCGERFCQWCIWTCVPRNFLNAQGQAKVRIPCPNAPQCASEVTVENLQEMDKNEFLKLLSATEESSKLRLCKSCQQLQHIEAFERLECQHWMCKYCLATKYDMNLQCPEDQRGVFKADFSAETLKDTCEVCNKDFIYKFSCPFSCFTASADGDFQACHGLCCNACLYQKLKVGVCCAKRKFATTEIEHYMGQIALKADCHDAIVSPAELVGQTSCDHIICKNCANERNRMQCLICGAAYVFPRELNSGPTCQACGGPGADLPLACGHMIHQECVGRLVQKACSHASCPQCRAYIAPALILGALPASAAAYRPFDDAYGYSFQFQCPHPNGQLCYISTGYEGWVQCTCHEAYFCATCLKPYEEQQHVCAYASSRQKADQLISEGKEVMQCPFCTLPTEWVDVEYVQCTGCQGYYSPCCVVPYYQIYRHGLAWHREDCVKWVGSQNTVLQDCCKGVLCPRPKALRRPRLIGPGEIST